MNNWISVKDRLPDKSAYYLTTIRDAQAMTKALWYSKNAGQFSCEEKYPTHWMPLPIPPKKAASK